VIRRHHHHDRVGLDVDSGSARRDAAVVPRCSAARAQPRRSGPDRVLEVRSLAGPITSRCARAARWSRPDRGRAGPASPSRMRRCNAWLEAFAHGSAPGRVHCPLLPSTITHAGLTTMAAKRWSGAASIGVPRPRPTRRFPTGYPVLGGNAHRADPRSAPSHGSLGMRATRCPAAGSRPRSRGRKQQVPHELRLAPP